MHAGLKTVRGTCRRVCLYISTLRLRHTCTQRKHTVAVTGISKKNKKNIAHTKKVERGRGSTGGAGNVDNLLCRGL